MSESEQRQAILDEEHLKLLRIGYYVSAGMNALFSLLGLVYIALGAFMAAVLSHLPARHGPPPAFVGWFMGAMGLGMFLCMLTLAILKFRAARCLGNHRSKSFCLVVAGIACLGFPYGTLLGVATFLVLGRPSVKGLFEAG